MNINFDYLYQITGGKQEFLLNLLKALTQALNTYPRQMRDSFAKGDTHAVAELAHKFKSSVSYLGFDTFNQALVGLETAKEQALAPAQMQALIAQVETCAAQALPKVADQMFKVMNGQA